MAKNITKLRHRFPLRNLRDLGRWTFAHWPEILLLLFVYFLCFANYQPNTWLTGWDNLHPEFNLNLDLQRSFFSVWQEYRGPGLLDGMAHAADLSRELLLIIWQKLGQIPMMLRYDWVFFSLGLGPLSVFLILKKLLLKTKFDPQTVRFASFLGGLFYLLNLATLQYFYTPFETFHSFFAFFPLLIFCLINYLEKPNFKRFFLLFLIAFFSSSAYYVQTLFIVALLCFLPISIEFQNHYHFKPKTLRTSLFGLYSIISTQLFWIFPVAFFTLTNAGFTSLARINAVSSPETALRNLEFANPLDIALLKGYWFNYLDMSLNQKYDYLLLVWRNHLSQPLITIIGFLSIFLIVVGIYYGVKKRILYFKSFVAIALICIFFLLGGSVAIGKILPILGEIFRSPFTKFSVALAFAYSIFFSIGCVFLLDLFSFLHYRLTYFLTLFTVTLLLTIYMTPAFTGNLISPTMRLKIPQEYFDTFNFFQSQDPATRIANFPQYTFWGWNYYNWGYRGSGFLWYGLKQPLLDRAFDVWSKSSQDYYEEMNSALFSEDQAQFENVMAKYGVNWLLIDNNVIPSSPNIDLGNTKLQKIIDNSNKFTLAANFGNIYIYKTNLDQSVKNFLSTGTISDKSFPFTGITLRPFTPPISSTAISLTAPVKKGKLTIPSYSETEALVPVGVSYRKTSTGLSLKFLPILANLSLSQNTIYPPALTPNYVTFDLPESVFDLIINLNGQYFEIQLPQEVDNQTTYSPLTTVYLPTQKPVNLKVYSNHPLNRLDLTNALSLAEPSQCYTNKPNRKIEKIVDHESISLFGTDMVGCLSAPLPFVPLNSLIALDFSYFSHTNTPANANITDASLGGQTSPQPLLAKDQPTFTRIYTESYHAGLQVNLILEANEIKNTQEIIYRDVSVSYLPFINSTNFVLNHIDPVITQNTGDTISFILPLLDNLYTVTSSAKDSHFTSSVLNCDNLNQGNVDRKIVNDGFLYTAQNASACDQINLKHLPHDTNYALLINNQNQEGLSPTVCLENYSTRRCDVFERLINGKQMIIQPVADTNETPGYTFHLFNESFGSSQITRNMIKSVAITPFPLNFLKNISVAGTDQPETVSQSPVTNSTHPAEFIYTATVNSSNPVLNLYQTKSPFWIALDVNEADVKLPLPQLILKTPILFLTSNRLATNRTKGADSWYNSWELPRSTHHLIIFYLPQYLEFIGFGFLPLPLIFALSFSLKKFLRHKQK